MSKFKVGDKVKRVIDVNFFVHATGGEYGVVAGERGSFILLVGDAFREWSPDLFELVDDWTIYNNTKPLSELSDEQRGLLFNYWCNNGNILVATNKTNSFYVVNYIENSRFIYRAKQKRELFIDAAFKSCPIFTDTKHDHLQLLNAMFDAGFKAPKVGG